MSRPRLSVVIISRNEGAELRRTIENIESTLPGQAEILVVDDASTDGSTKFLRSHRSVRFERVRELGVAGARNFGAKLTSGRMIVFADAHIRVPDGWWQALEHALSNRRVAAAAPAIAGLHGARRPGYGLTFTGPDMEVKWLQRPSNGSSAGVPILPGCCLAMTRTMFEETGGWDDGLLQRGGVDNEFSIRHWLLGYELRIVPEIDVLHLFRKQSPYKVGWEQYLHNRLRLAISHLSPERLGQALSALSTHRELEEALQLAASRGAWTRREQLFSSRKRNDDWYFRKFGLEW